MKKKITIFIAIIAIISLTVLAYYLVSNSNKKVVTEKKPAEKVKISQPKNYCYITYQISNDSGKTWHEVVLNKGVKPLSKAECWKRYINKLKNFPTQATEGVKWESKNIKNKILANPAMKFSDKPFEHLTKEENISHKANSKSTINKK